MTSLDAKSPIGAGPFMCGRCSGHAELGAWIRSNAVSPECTFCGRMRQRNIAADAEELAEFVAQCISLEYEDAAEMVAWDEGEYVASTMTSSELLEEIGVEEVNAVAFSFLADGLPDKAWVQVDFYSQHPEQTLKHGWDGFAHAIKHETRFMFFPPIPKTEWKQHDEIRPEDMLAELGNVIREHRMVKRLRAGTRLYRIRPGYSANADTGIRDLGSPPVEAIVRANRMSPAGISMFYAATDRETAIAESLDPQGCVVGTLATFELVSPARIADFVRVPRAPGFFSLETTREERGRLNFLNAFADEISRAVARDQYDHIEYVPTQVVTEYLRFRFVSKKRALAGVRFRSAKRAGGINVALFLGHDDFEPMPAWRDKPAVQLRLVEHEPIDVKR
jgi:hypothetical protein